MKPVKQKRPHKTKKLDSGDDNLIGAFIGLIVFIGLILYLFIHAFKWAGSDSAKHKQAKESFYTECLAMHTQFECKALTKQSF